MLNPTLCFPSLLCALQLASVLSAEAAQALRDQLDERLKAASEGTLAASTQGECACVGGGVGVGGGGEEISNYPQFLKKSIAEMDAPFPVSG